MRLRRRSRRAGRPRPLRAARRSVPLAVWTERATSRCCRSPAVQRFRGDRGAGQSGRLPVVVRRDDACSRGRRPAESLSALAGEYSGRTHADLLRMDRGHHDSFAASGHHVHLHRAPEFQRPPALSRILVPSTTRTTRPSAGRSAFTVAGDEPGRVHRHLRAVGRRAGPLRGRARRQRGGEPSSRSRRPHVWTSRCRLAASARPSVGHWQFHGA